MATEFYAWEPPPSSERGELLLCTGAGSLLKVERCQSIRHTLGARNETFLGWLVFEKLMSGHDGALAATSEDQTLVACAKETDRETEGPKAAPAHGPGPCYGRLS